jgi:nucleotide-binding universal stress UspA family protein
MTLTTLLVHAEPSPAAEPRLAAAAALARRFDAELIGVGAEMFDWATLSDPYGFNACEWITVLQDQAQADLAQAEAAFRRCASGLRHRWVSVLETPARAMCELSRSADLIVTGGAPLNGRTSARTADPADLVLGSGRPVLVAPPHGGDLRPRRIVVAWKDTRESRRALADALPFLVVADEVVVIEACDAADLSDAEARTAAVATYLRRHSVTARGRAIACPPDRVATDLKIEAQALDADLIVAGAYGHNRAREWLLGGVTFELLHAPETFVLLSH